MTTCRHCGEPVAKNDLGEWTVDDGEYCPDTAGGPHEPRAVHALEIRPDGTVVEHDGPFWLNEARRVIGGDVESAACPDPIHVLTVGQFSTFDNADEPNPVAWLCYGRSQLYGTACLFRDDEGPLTPDIVEMVHRLAALVAAGDPQAAYRAADDYWHGVR